MKNVNKIVVVVDEEQRRNTLKTLTKRLKAEIIKVEPGVDEEGKNFVAIHAIADRKKVFKNCKRILQYGDIAIVN